MRTSTANRHGSKWIRPDKRLRIYARDNFHCAYCASPVYSPATIDDPKRAPSNARIATLDHLKPRDKGGSNDESNLVTCCLSCNSARQNRPVSAFARDVAADLDVTAQSITNRVRKLRARVLPTLAAAERAVPKPAPDTSKNLHCPAPVRTVPTTILKRRESNSELLFRVDSIRKLIDTTVRLHARAAIESDRETLTREIAALRFQLDRALAELLDDTKTRKSPRSATLKSVSKTNTVIRRRHPVLTLSNEFAANSTPAQ